MFRPFLEKMPLVWIIYKLFTGNTQFGKDYRVLYHQAKGPPNPMHFLPPKTHTAKRTADGGPFCALSPPPAGGFLRVVSCQGRKSGVQ